MGSFESINNLHKRRTGFKYTHANLMQKTSKQTVILNSRFTLFDKRACIDTNFDCARSTVGKS